MNRPVPLEVFSLSFIDLFSCAFGGMMLLMILFSIEQQDDSSEPPPLSIHISVHGAENGRTPEIQVGPSEAEMQSVKVRKVTDSMFLSWTTVPSSSTRAVVRVENGEKTVSCDQAQNLEMLLQANIEENPMCLAISNRDLGKLLENEETKSESDFTLLQDRDSQIDHLNKRKQVLTRLGEVLMAVKHDVLLQSMARLDARVSALQRAANIGVVPAKPPLSAPESSYAGRSWIDKCGEPTVKRERLLVCMTVQSGDRYCFVRCECETSGRTITIPFSQTVAEQTP